MLFSRYLLSLESSSGATIRLWTPVAAKPPRRETTTIRAGSIRASLTLLFLMAKMSMTAEPRARAIKI